MTHPNDIAVSPTAWVAFFCGVFWGFIGGGVCGWLLW